MINECRTLLLGAPIAGPEYVPPEMRRISFPANLLAIRNVLFGAGPSPQDMNGRVHQYMQVLHSTELDGLVRAMDPRVTYIPFTSDAPPAPQPDLGSVLAALDTAGDANLIALFGVEADEPWPTLRNLWERELTLPYRLGAALMALALRTRAMVGPRGFATNPAISMPAIPDGGGGE